MRRQLAAVALVLSFAVCGMAGPITWINTNAANKSVIYFYAADAVTGEVIRAQSVGTGFLISVPSKNDPASSYSVIVTARHILEPRWACSNWLNPPRLYVRVNKKGYDASTDVEGVSYIAVDLYQNGRPRWNVGKDDTIDAAILPAPGVIVSGDYDVAGIRVREFGTLDEISKLGPGSQVASTGMVPGAQGQRRNYPVFKFGKIASIPSENIPIPCGQGVPARQLKVWLLNITLVGGNSGSPIFFDPMFPPNSAVRAGEPRPMIIGLQSMSIGGADLAGMTPAKDIIEILATALPVDADLTLGPTPQ